RVVVLYQDADFEALKKAFAKSNCRTISGYVRKVSLQQPVEIITRNASFDDLVQEIVSLRKELASVRQTFRTGSENEVRLLSLQEDIRDRINKIADLCMPH